MSKAAETRDAAMASGGTFAGVGGIEIFWQSWLPEADPEAVVVIAHGVSEHSGRYAHVGKDLAIHGYAVYALDHRGHGRSGGTRCVLDRLDNAVEDIGTMIGIARERNPGKKLFLLGHSMGGNLSLGYALKHQEALDGLILSGPAVSLESASAAQRAVAKVLSSVAPRLGVYGVDSDGVSKDPAVVRDYDEDPLNFHKKVPARTVGEMAEAMVTYPERLPSLRIPLLILHGADDTLVPPDASEMVDRYAGSPDKKLVMYPGLRHEILNEPEQQTVLTDIRNWLSAQL